MRPRSGIKGSVDRDSLGISMSVLVISVFRRCSLDVQHVERAVLCVADRGLRSFTASSRRSSPTLELATLPAERHRSGSAQRSARDCAAFAGWNLAGLLRGECWWSGAGLTHARGSGMQPLAAANAPVRERWVLLNETERINERPRLNLEKKARKGFCVSARWPRQSLSL